MNKAKTVKISFDSPDDFISQLGFRPYHIFLFILSGLMGLSDGCQSLSQSIVLPKLREESFISEENLKILESLSFVGILFGSLMAGPISDSVGRRKPLLAFYALLTISSYLSSIARNEVEFMIARFGVGIAVGFAMPISFSVLAENLPLSVREKMLASIGIFYTLGQVISCVFLHFSFESLRVGDWRYLLRLSALLPLLTFTANFLLLEESVNFLCSSASGPTRLPACASELKSIISRIYPASNLKESAPMEDILKTFNKNKQLGSSSGISSLLLSKDTLRLTLAVWICCIINNIV